MKIGIAKKLFIFFLFFFLIFCGTVFDLFFKVQEMSRISRQIVEINNQVAALSKNLRDSLIDMDANIKKYRLLKKNIYIDYFNAARTAYENDLARIIRLEAESVTRQGSQRLWARMQNEFVIDPLFGNKNEDEQLSSGSWPDEERVSHWIGAIANARLDNDKQIEQALIRINDKSRQVVKNVAVGFGLTLIAGVLGIIFITRSVIRPLEKLKSGLKQVSQDNYAHEVVVDSADEFGELARTFNEMNRLLKADEEIRSDFIATLSHEIRTPLSSIRESVNMITEEVLGPVNKKQAKFLKIAGDEIVRITSLLNHLLDTSMLDSGKEEPRPVPLDPNQLAEVAVLGLSAAAKRRDITLTFTPLPSPPLVAGVEKEVMQVLANLLDNALKFSPAGAEVVVSLAAGPDSGFLTFRVSDSGPGIPADKQALIFKKYYRTKEVRDHMDGVGLGLSIARRIVLAHGGKIFVNNRERGCTFSFMLPLYRADQV